MFLEYGEQIITFTIEAFVIIKEKKFKEIPIVSSSVKAICFQYSYYIL